MGRPGANLGGSAYRLARASLFVGWLACCAAAQALNLDVPLTKLQHTVWQARDGFPQAAKTAIAQSADGYLWFSSYAGLTRFDGQRFDYVTLPRIERLTSSSVYSLYAPPSGGLWIGFTFGGVGFFKDGQLTFYDETDGLPKGSARSITEDADGALLVATTSGLVRLEKGRFVRLLTNTGTRQEIIYEVMVDSEGTIWVFGLTVTYLRRGESTFRQLPGRFEGVISAAQSARGEIWLSDMHGLHRVSVTVKGDGRTRGTHYAVMFDRDGAMWATTEHGLWRATHPEALDTQVVLKNGQYGEMLSFSEDVDGTREFESHDGTIWLLGDQTLNRFTPSNVERLDLSIIPDETQGQYGIASGERGAIWVIPAGGPLVRVQDGHASEVAAVRDISSIATVADGTSWLGGPNGLLHYAEGRYVDVPMPVDAKDFDMQAIARAGNGDIWISVVRKGTYRLRDGKWSAYGDLPSPFPRLAAVSACTDSTGQVWFGYNNGQIAIVEGDRAKLVGPAEGVNVGVVYSLFSRGTRVWAGGEFGLVLWDGARFHAVRSERARAFDAITGIIETASGDLWLNSALGIVHVPAAQLRELVDEPSHPVSSEVFDLQDGFLGNAARIRPLPAAVEGTNGMLWFVSNVGVFSIDPTKIQRNTAPPNVLIQGLTADGRQYEPSKKIVLPERTRALRIDFIGLSLGTQERVSYRYRLEGVDKDWQDVQGRHEAFYTNLDPGHYEFQVTASNGNGVWRTADAPLKFDIAPTFIQTGWFFLICTVSAIGALVVLFRLRLRQVAARMRWRSDTLLAERDRIARDLHDTLLQSTQGLILRFQAVANRLGQNDSNREMLEQALDRADEVLTEGRERVRGLRRSTDIASELVKQLCEAGQELTEGSPTLFRATCDGMQPAMTGEVGDEIYLITREAISNAVRHAEARAIDVHVVYTSEEVRVLILDDGIGIDTAVIRSGSREGHWGLRGMRERAERIGATVEIQRRGEAGTQVELRWNIAAARRGST